jgi:imidazoleglycerol-phosphate dehydratase
MTATTAVVFSELPIRFPMPDFAPRTAQVERTTAETSVRVRLGLDGEGSYANDTGVGFFDHMLDLFAKHGGFDLEAACDGDLQVDDHHTVEDVGITLGQALDEALGDRGHIARYGHACLPMDEALARVAVDLSGRSFCRVGASFDRDAVGGLSTEMVSHFWRSLAQHGNCTLHVDLLAGTNAHHKIEAMFKAGARAFRAAVARSERHAAVASTKGRLSEDAAG